MAVGGEATDGRRQAQRPVARVGPVEAPLTGLGAVKPQGQAVDPGAGRRAVDPELVDVRATVPQRLGARGALVLDPVGRAAQRLREPAELHLPAAEDEVEVVLAVARRGGVGGGGSWGRRGGGCASVL